MYLPVIGTQVMLGIIGAVLSGLGLLSIYLINKHIENNQLKTIMTSLNSVVYACVQEVYQTYVEELQEKNMFDKAEQHKALEMCLEKIHKVLPKHIEQWLDDNFDDIKVYLVTLIESTIANLKLVGRDGNERSKKCI